MRDSSLHGYGSPNHDTNVLSSSPSIGFFDPATPICHRGDDGCVNENFFMKTTKISHTTRFCQLLRGMRLRHRHSTAALSLPGHAGQQKGVRHLFSSSLHGAVPGAQNQTSPDCLSFRPKLSLRGWTEKSSIPSLHCSTACRKRCNPHDVNSKMAVADSVVSDISVNASLSGEMRNLILVQLRERSFETSVIDR